MTWWLRLSRPPPPHLLARGSQSFLTYLSGSDCALTVVGAPFESWEQATVRVHLFVLPGTAGRHLQPLSLCPCGAWAHP